MPISQGIGCYRGYHLKMAKDDRGVMNPGGEEYKGKEEDSIKIIKYFKLTVLVWEKDFPANNFSSTT